MLHRRLSDYRFNDLYLGPRLTPKVRWLEPSVSDQPRELVELPDDLKTDARELLIVIRRTHAATRQREFTVQYDEVAYRASLIANPADRRPAENWVLRRHRTISLRQLGLPEMLMRDYLGAVNKSGLIINAGPFSSGKSTTASAVLDAWLARHGNVGVIIGDPVEAMLPQQYESGGQCYPISITDREIVDTIKAARRWAPRYVLIEEIRTPAAAAEALHMATSGPIVVTTLQADNPIAAVTSMVKWAAKDVGDVIACQMLAQALQIVTVQTIDDQKRRQFEWLTLNESLGQRAAIIRTKIRTGQINHLIDDIHQQRFQRQRETG